MLCRQAQCAQHTGTHQQTNSEEEFLRFFSVQEFVCHMQDIREHHEEVTNFSSYHRDIETEVPFPSLKHNSEASIGVTDV